MKTCQPCGAVSDAATCPNCGEASWFDADHPRAPDLPTPPSGVAVPWASSPPVLVPSPPIATESIPEKLTTRKRGNR